MEGLAGRGLDQTVLRLSDVDLVFAVSVHALAMGQNQLRNSKALRCCPAAVFGAECGKSLPRAAGR